MAKSNSNVTKVGGAGAEKSITTKEIPEKAKGRVDFPKKSAMYRDKDGNVITALNAEGLLLAVPATILDGEKVVYSGFDPRKHNPLKKSDFVSMATFLQYQGYVARSRAARLIKVAETKEAAASRLLKFGDEQTRKKAAKIAKMRDQLKALEMQLMEEGIDVSDI